MFYFLSLHSLHYCLSQLVLQMLALSLDICTEVGLPCHTFHTGCCYNGPSHSSSVSCLFKCGLRRSFMNETMWSKHHLTSGAPEHRLKQARKEWIYLETCEKAWAEKTFLQLSLLHTGSTNHRRTTTFEGAVGERRRFDFWWVSFVNIKTPCFFLSFFFKLLNIDVLFCWVCTVTAAAMPISSPSAVALRLPLVPVSAAAAAALSCSVELTTTSLPFKGQ